MQRDAPWSTNPPDVVVHVVGHITAAVGSFLGPTSHTLARCGMRQVVVLIDEARHRHQLLNLHESAELVLAPASRNPFMRWSGLLLACSQAMGRGSPFHASPLHASHFHAGHLHAVHLHGLLPSLLGAMAARGAGVTAPIFFSPHGSRLLMLTRPLARPLLWLAAPLLRPWRVAAIVNMAQEVGTLAQWKSVQLVESPVAADFFNVARNEARHPLVVTGGRVPSARAAELIAQLAVLLGDDALRLSFNWIGEVDPVSERRLSAAGVAVFDVELSAQIAQRLAAGWIYADAGGTRGFPVLLSEAMAVGLPCVAVDSTQNRQLIRHGETGFLCATEREMLECIARLIDDEALRVRIGQAARDEASSRFGESGFSSRLLAAYAAGSPRHASSQGVTT